MAEASVGAQVPAFTAEEQDGERNEEVLDCREGISDNQNCDGRTSGSFDATD